MFYLSTRFQMPSYYYSLVIDIKWKAKYSSTPVAVSHSKKKSLTKVVYFSKIYYCTIFEDPTLNGTSVAPTSEIHMAVMLVLLLQGT